MVYKVTPRLERDTCNMYLFFPCYQTNHHGFLYLWDYALLGTCRSWDDVRGLWKWHQPDTLIISGWLGMALSLGKNIVGGITDCIRIAHVSRNTWSSRFMLPEPYVM